MTVTTGRAVLSIGEKSRLHSLTVNRCPEATPHHIVTALVLREDLSREGVRDRESRHPGPQEPARGLGHHIGHVVVRLGSYLQAMVSVTERHLLYVACTRARDHLIVTGVAPASEFLDDLQE